MFLIDFSEAIKKFAEASRLRRERDKLQKLVIQLNGALTEKDSSIAGIAKIANRCFEIMRACAKNVQKEKILQSITQLNTKMFLEKFISFKKDTEIFSKFQKKILESKRFIERTIENINVIEAKEKAEAALRQVIEAKKVEAHKRALDEEAKRKKKRP